MLVVGDNTPLGIVVKIKQNFIGFAKGIQERSAEDYRRVFTADIIDMLPTRKDRFERVFTLHIHLKSMGVLSQSSNAAPVTPAGYETFEIIFADVDKHCSP
jgi:hypothetical protein